MKFPWSGRPAPPPAPAAPSGSPEARLLAACAEADELADKLMGALRRRRQAIVDLAAVTHLGGKASLNNQVMPGAVWAALSCFGDAKQMLGLPHVHSGHRRSLEHQARAAIGASAAWRADPIGDVINTLATAADRAGGTGGKEFA